MQSIGRDGWLWVLLPAMLALSACSGSGTSSLGPSFTVGGYVSGLTGSGLKLSYNGAPLPISRNGAFTASTAVTTGSTYMIAIATQPTNPAQTCVVSNGSGTIEAASVTSVRVFCPQAAGRFAYLVSGGNPPLVLGSIAVHAIDPATGALTLVPGSAVSTGSSVISFQIIPGSPFAWALNFGNITQVDNGAIYNYTVNASTGRLTPVAGNPFFALNGTAQTPPACPAGVNGLGLTDAVTFPPMGGAFGYASNAAVGSATNSGVWSFTFDPVSGAPTGLGSSAPGACSSSPVTVDPSGQFAYFGGYASTALDAPGLYAFTIDAMSGALTPVVDSPVTIGSPPNTVVTIDPTGQFAYAPQGALIFAFKIDPASGALTPIAGSPFMVPASTSAMAIEPTGAYAYVSTAKGLYAYSIDSSTGALSPVGSPVVLLNAQTLRIDPSGQFLYVAAAAGGVGQQGTYAYTVDDSTGALTAVAGSPFAVGAMSPAVMAIAN
jgi:6-phosphogluconolactonase